MASENRTKKVNTYGRKKTQIISVHSDFTSPNSNASPIAPPVKRPALKAKPSHDNYNICPSTPLATKNSDVKGQQKLTHGSILSKPGTLPSQAAKQKAAVGDNAPRVYPIKERKVPRKTTKALIPISPLATPKSPRAETKPTSDNVKASPLRPAARKPRMIFEGVVIPLRPGRFDPSMNDLSKKLASITIKDEPSPRQVSVAKVHRSTTTPLESLVQGCTSQTIHNFASFIDDFPLLSPLKTITKVGEASYSEVFGFSSSPAEKINLVMKIVPLFSTEVETELPLPDCSMSEDVSREIEITKRLGKVPGGGFVQCKGAWVVQGEYPKLLLEQWDIYKRTEGSASVRPSAFPPSQKYCLIALSHSGIDLEAFKFDPSRGWLQAAGVFWQVAAALASAEDWTKFEHRDLHEGQVLIASSPSQQTSSEVENYLSISYTSVLITIIDFGLSRLDMPKPEWSAVPEEVYEGKGAQWDLYRAMRDRIGGNWEGYHPVTNVMWLQYLLHYILENKSLKKPRPPQPSRTRGTKVKADTVLSARAYNMLQRVDKALTWSVDLGVRRTGLRGGETELESKLGSAREVLDWGKSMDWIADI